jgi:hypothetical protein
MFEPSITGVTRFSLVEAVRLIVRVLAETAIRLGNKPIAFRLNFGFCFRMSRKDGERLKELILSRPPRLVNAREASFSICGLVHESTFRRWMKNGRTSFGMPLDVSIKNNHLVIPQFQAYGVERELTARSNATFERDADAFEAELKSGVPLRPRPLKPKSSRPDRHR